MIGIITLNPDTFTNPTLYSILKKLNERGISTTLFCGHQSYAIPEELDLTRYHDFPMSVVLPARPSNIVKYLFTFFTVLAYLKKNKIEHLLAIDIFGLVMAGRVKKFLSKINIHYCSFEIFFSKELKNHPILLKIKKKEIQYSKKLSSIIIQDEERKKLLMHENKIDPNFNNWHLIPVSPILNTTKEYKKYKKSDFGLKENDIVYIHSGSVGTWAGINLIIEALKKGLPDHTFILIHNRSKFDPNDETHKALIELKEAGASLILHDQLFESYNDYFAFLLCFDYGITLYQPDDGIFTGMNIQEIGLASGKFSTYMMAGLPTLLSECNTYRSILNNYSIGELVTAEKDLFYHINEKTLFKINGINCKQFYKEVLNPNEPIDYFINYINN